MLLLQVESVIPEMLNLPPVAWRIIVIFLITIAFIDRKNVDNSIKNLHNKREKLEERLDQRLQKLEEDNIRNTETLNRIQGIVEPENHENKLMTNGSCLNNLNATKDSIKNEMQIAKLTIEKESLKNCSCN